MGSGPSYACARPRAHPGDAALRETAWSSAVGGRGSGFGQCLGREGSTGPYCRIRSSMRRMSCSSSGRAIPSLSIASQANIAHSRRMAGTRNDFGDDRMSSIRFASGATDPSVIACQVAGWMRKN